MLDGSLGEMGGGGASVVSTPCHVGQCSSEEFVHKYVDLGRSCQSNARLQLPHQHVHTHASMPKHACSSSSILHCKLLSCDTRQRYVMYVPCSATVLEVLNDYLRCVLPLCWMLTSSCPADLTLNYVSIMLKSSCLQLSSNLPCLKSAMLIMLEPNILKILMHSFNPYSMPRCPCLNILCVSHTNEMITTTILQKMTTRRNNQHNYCIATRIVICVSVFDQSWVDAKCTCFGGSLKGNNIVDKDPGVCKSLVFFYSSNWTKILLLLHMHIPFSPLPSKLTETPTQLFGPFIQDRRSAKLCCAVLPHHPTLGSTSMQFSANCWWPDMCDWYGWHWGPFCTHMLAWSHRQPYCIMHTSSPALDHACLIQNVNIDLGKLSFTLAILMLCHWCWCAWIYLDKPLLTQAVSRETRTHLTNHFGFICSSPLLVILCRHRPWDRSSFCCFESCDCICLVAVTDIVSILFLSVLPSLLSYISLYIEGAELRSCASTCPLSCARQAWDFLFYESANTDSDEAGVHDGNFSPRMSCPFSDSGHCQHPVWWSQDPVHPLASTHSLICAIHVFSLIEPRM